MDSISFKDIKIGTVFWECESGKNAQFRALTNATTDRFREIWEFTAERIKTGETQHFMMRVSANGYAPRLYLSPQYAPAEDNA